MYFWGMLNFKGSRMFQADEEFGLQKYSPERWISGQVMAKGIR